MALYHVQPCAWDQLGSVGCHNFLKSFDEETPLVEKTLKKERVFWFAKKTSSKHVFFPSFKLLSEKKAEKKVLLKKCFLKIGP